MRKLRGEHEMWVIDAGVEVTDLTRKVNDGILSLRGQGYEIVSVNINWSSDLDLGLDGAWTATITTLKPW